MYRDANDKLYKWKKENTRMPLVVNGAPCVGKTWLIKEFGNKAFKNTVYIDIESESEITDMVKAIVESGFENPESVVKNIITGIELYAGHSINSADTLIIFDNVHRLPEIFNIIESFYENKTRYYIICAGVGIEEILQEEWAHLGKIVEIINMYPMTFKEFLIAMSKEKLAEMLDNPDWKDILVFKNIYSDLLRQYFFVGGMPEAVQSFAIKYDFAEVRKIQKRIVKSYKQMMKGCGRNALTEKMCDVWNSVPVQLAKENKKFMYGFIKEGSRAKEYENAIKRLCGDGVLHKVHRIGDNGKDEKVFKLFITDIGLLCCMMNISKKQILDKNRIFTEYNEALTEQYICQQLIAMQCQKLFYYTNERSECEVNFVIECDKKYIPVEINLMENLRAKSLLTYCEKYKPEISFRISIDNYEEKNNIITCPVYSINEIYNKNKNIIKNKPGGGVIRKAIRNKELIIKKNGIINIIQYKNICYLESKNHNVNIYTVGESVKVYMSLSEIEAMLPQDIFFRCHRSFVVNLNHIKKIENMRAYTDVGIADISRNKNKELNYRYLKIKRQLSE